MARSRPTDILTLDYVREFLGDRLLGSLGSHHVDLSAGLVPLTGAAHRGGLTFVNATSGRNVENVLKSRAGAALCPAALARKLEGSPPAVTLLCVARPRLEFSQIAIAWSRRRNVPTIHSTAVIGKGARIGERISIGPGAVVEDDAVIGDDCVLGASAFVGSSVRLGSRVKLGAHTIIGGPGFGFERAYPQRTLPAPVAMQRPV